MRPKSEAEGDRGELTCDGAPFELRCGGNLLAVEQRLGPRDRSSANPKMSAAPRFLVVTSCWTSTRRPNRSKVYARSEGTFGGILPQVRLRLLTCLSLGSCAMASRSRAPARREKLVSWPSLRQPQKKIILERRRKGSPHETPPIHTDFRRPRTLA